MASIISAGPSVRYGWESVKKHLWFFVGIAFISTVIGSIGSKTDDSMTYNLLGFLASTWMTCGTTMIYLQFRRGTKPELGTLFTTLSPYLSVLGISILYALMVGIGLLFLIFPGIYLAIKYQFAVPLAVDNKLGVFEALSRSGEMTKGRKMDLFLFDLTMIGVMILGVLALGVGVLVAIPVVGLAAIDLYEKLQGEKPVTTAATPTASAVA